MHFGWFSSRAYNLFETCFCCLGAVREYLVRYCSILHPPDIGCTLPVDIGNVSDMDLEQIGVNYVLLTTPLPTATEGKFFAWLKILKYDFKIELNFNQVGQKVFLNLKNFLIGFDVHEILFNSVFKK